MNQLLPQDDPGASLVIDCSCEPFLLPHLSVVRHVNQGLLEWDWNRVVFFRSAKQEKGDLAYARDLLIEVKDSSLIGVNASVLDYFLDGDIALPFGFRSFELYASETVFSDGAGQCLSGIRFDPEREEYERVFRWVGAAFENHQALLCLRPPE